MAERRFDIIFDGSVINGSNVDDVKGNLQTIFKLDSESINKLFCGTPIAIKKNLDRQTATRYQTALTKAGANIQLVLHRESNSENTQPANVSNKDSDASHSGELSILPRGSDLLSVSERTTVPEVAINVDHLQLEKANPFLVDDAPVTPAMGQATASAEPTYPAMDVAIATDTITLASPGADIGDQNSLPPLMDINTDYLDIDPLGTYLVEQNSQLANEKNDAMTKDALLAATAALSLCEPGADILRPDEKPAYTAVEVDTSALTLSDDTF